MKKTMLIIALVTLVAFVGVAMAQPKPGPAPAPTTPAPEKPKMEKVAKMEKYSGVVDKVDEMAKTIVVKGKKDEKTFMIDAMTKITKAGKDMPLVDLKKDMHVSVEYKKDGDKMTAGSIRVAAPKAAPKKEKPAEAPKK